MSIVDPEYKSLNYDVDLIYLNECKITYQTHPCHEIIFIIKRKKALIDKKNCQILPNMLIQTNLRKTF